MTVLAITLTTAAAAAFLNFWLAMRIGALRRRFGIIIGDGGNPALVARMRAQSNFVEYAPFFLILLGLVELAVGYSLWLWLAAIAFILGRILHAFGMDKATLNPLRNAGIALTMISLLGLALYAIAIPYLHKHDSEAIHIAAVQPLASTLSPTKGLVFRS